MSLTFEGETLNIGGFELTGTVLVEVRVTDASFANEFGVEHVEDIEWLPGNFVPDDPRGQTLKYALVYRAVSAWIDTHEKVIMAAYERKVKACRDE